MKRVLNILAILLTSTICFAQARYELPADYVVLEQSRLILKKQIGVKERGDNRGPEIKKYLASVGLNEGHPYCAAGQYFCFAEAVKRLELGKEKIPINRTAVANKMYEFGAQNGRRTAYFPQIDDLLVWRRVASPYGHIERITDILGNGWVRTVGFNTSSGAGGNQADGGGVYQRKRNIYHILGRMQVRGLIGFKK